MVQFSVLLYSFSVLLYSSVLLCCSLLFILLCSSSSCYVCVFDCIYFTLKLSPGVNTIAVNEYSSTKKFFQNVGNHLQTSNFKLSLVLKPFQLFSFRQNPVPSEADCTIRVFTEQSGFSFDVYRNNDMWHLFIEACKTLPTNPITQQTNRPYFQTKYKPDLNLTVPKRWSSHPVRVAEAGGIKIKPVREGDWGGRGG
jgi:hypothetical protein